MNIGTKTLLYGGHQILLHPLLVLVAWVRIYHKLPNIKELICIIIHDWGYWGKTDIDGVNGEMHPLWAARLSGVFLGMKYARMCAYHSRFLARRAHVKPSSLCLPDKLGVAMMPTWLLVFLGALTGETREYMAQDKYEVSGSRHESPWEFYRAFKAIAAKWAVSRDPTVGGEEDTYVHHSH